MARCGAHHSVRQDLVVLQWDKTLNFHTQEQRLLTQRQKDRAKCITLLSYAAECSDGSLSHSAGCRPVDFQQWKLVPVLLETIKISFVSKCRTIRLAGFQSATSVWLERWLLRLEVTVFLGSWDSISFSFSSSVHQLCLFIITKGRSELTWKIWILFFSHH